MLGAYVFTSCLAIGVLFLMIRRPPRSTRANTLFPYPTLFRSTRLGARVEAVGENLLCPAKAEYGSGGAFRLRTTPARSDWSADIRAAVPNRNPLSATP